MWTQALKWGALAGVGIITAVVISDIGLRLVEAGEQIGGKLFAGAKEKVIKLREQRKNKKDVQTA